MIRLGGALAVAVAACAILTVQPARAAEEIASCWSSSTPSVTVGTWGQLPPSIDCADEFSVSDATVVQVRVTVSPTFTGNVGFAFCRDDGGIFCADSSSHSVRFAAGVPVDPNDVSRVLPPGNWIFWTYHGKTFSPLPRTCVRERPPAVCPQPAEQYVVADTNVGSYQVVVTST